MNILPSASPSKEMGDHAHESKKKSLTSAGMELMTSRFDRPLLNQLSYEEIKKRLTELK